MRRLILPAVLAFAFSVPAQNFATSSTGQTSTTTKTSKTLQLTGCVSALANSEGNYTFTNGRYKKAVELIPGPASEDISTHAGHEVQLTGNWISEPSASKNAGAQKYDKHFLVTSIQHLSDTCPSGSDPATQK